MAKKNRSPIKFLTAPGGSNWRCSECGIQVMHCAKRGSKIVCYEHIYTLVNPGEHPCKDCKAHAENGRVECPTMKREIELEGCNKQRGRSPREARSYLKNF